jgi:hypothetical protein
VNIRKRGGVSAKFAEPTGFDWLDSSRLDLDLLDLNPTVAGGGRLAG